MKKLLVTFLTIILLFSFSLLLTACKKEEIKPNVNDNTQIETPKVTEGLDLELSSNQTYYIVAGLGNATDKEIVIPSVFNDLPVKEIAANAFENCTSLTSIEIPNSVTTIGEEAFFSCTNLTNIEIPNSVTSIGEWAFCFCFELTSIEIPNSVKRIEDHTFSSCFDLTSIKIGNGVKSIGGCAFSGCSSLTSIKIPNSVTSIGIMAFDICESLASIEIPSSVTSIGSGAFYGCENLETINYRGTKTKWNKIEKGFDWNWVTGEYVINCTDGILLKQLAAMY